MKNIKFCILLLSCAIILTKCSEQKSIADYSFPFTFENNRIVLVASIDGSSGKYFFDTGCEGIITNTPIKSLKKIVRPYDHYYLLGSVKKYDAYAVNSIKFYSTPFSVSTFVLQSDTKLLGFDGIIGLSVFKGYFVEISFDDNVIRLYKDKPKGYNNKVAIYFGNNSCPYLQSNIDGINVPFLIDTGSPANIIFPLPIASCIDRSKYQRILSGNESYESYRVNIKYYNDGFRVYKNITGDSNPLSTLNNGELFAQYGNLGLDYLHHFNLVIDNRGYPITSMYYTNRSFIANFYPGKRGIWLLGGRMNAQYNNLGLDGWQFNNNKMYISSVIEKGKAYLAGIHPGTEVVQINNKSVNEFSYKQIDDLLLFNKHKLTLKCIINNKETIVELN
jgi:hypothetical protein